MCLHEWGMIMSVRYPALHLWILLCANVITSLFANGEVCADNWRAGAATEVITPEIEVWMGGYGARKQPAQGTIHDLHVKALALEDPDGSRSVIVTADLIATTRDFSNRVAERIGKQYGLSREAIFINNSHTHCGPETHVPYMFYIPSEWKDEVDEYLIWLEDRFVSVISRALDGLEPAEISFTTAKPVPFAVSRRLPTPEGIAYRSGPSSYYTGGPRDDISPVLTVTGKDGSVRAILFGYACHPITLNIDYYCGDYPGFAQLYVEEAFPGATAMFVQGCAGQLVPNARYQIEYAEGHGHALADAVIEAVNGERTPVTGTMASAYEEIPLEFEPLPDRDTLMELASSDNNYLKNKATYYLAKLDKGESISNIEPWPFQTIRIGDGLLLVGLSGEAVVEYSLKFKSAFPMYDFVWVAGYTSHVLGYLPTWRIQREGGYEGGTSYNHMPTTGMFTETVEKLVTDGVTRLAEQVTPQ